MEDQVLFDIESNPKDGFFSIYAGLRMLLDHESRWQIDKNKDQSKEKQVFSIVGAEAYCRIQQLKESHGEMVAAAELRYDSIFKKELFCCSNRGIRQVHGRCLDRIRT